MISSKFMKIKTITCHDVYNFGASLQAYALMTYLTEMGHDVEIIDYKPEYSSYNVWAIGPRWRKNIFSKTLYYMYVVPKRLSLKSRRKRFDAFTQSRLKLTRTKYHSNNELVENPPEADLYFAGSDQIWNPKSHNGKDPSFYLNFASERSVKASYAASFSVSEVQNELKPTIKEWLTFFDFISVREKTGIEILTNLGFENAEVVVDPVYLLTKNKWFDLAKDVINFDTKYIFIYDQENNQEIRNAAKDLAKKRNLKIVAIEALYPMNYADVKIKDAGPEEFLGLIKNCDVCLTNSFHCVSFSLIFNKEFYLFPRTHENVNSRMIDLLTSLNLNHKIWDKSHPVLDDVKIDYEDVDKLIVEKKISSQYYIQKVIETAYIKYEKY